MLDFMDDDCDIEGFPLEDRVAKLREGVAIEDFISALFDDVFCIEDDDIRLYEIAKNRVEFKCEKVGDNVSVLFRFCGTAYTTFIYSYDKFNEIFEVI